MHHFTAGDKLTEYLWCSTVRHFPQAALNLVSSKAVVVYEALLQVYGICDGYALFKQYYKNNFHGEFPWPCGEDTFRGVPKAHPDQLREIIPPVSSGSSPGFPLGRSQPGRVPTWWPNCLNSGAVVAFSRHRPAINIFLFITRTRIFP